MKGDGYEGTLEKKSRFYFVDIDCDCVRVAHFDAGAAFVADFCSEREGAKCKFNLFGLCGDALLLFFSYLREISQVNLDFSTLSASNRFVKEELLSEEDGDVSIQNIDSIRLDNPKSKINDKEISFDIQTELNRGDRLYLSGASGAGKSTLLKMLLKFRRSEGIFVNKLPIASIANDSLRARIAYLSQDVSLLSLSLEENIAFGRKMTNEEKQVVEQSKILETVFRDKSWDTVLVENGANLSGGEKQRIAVARLLLMDFDICILDEVTSNIDEESSDAIFEILERICRDKIMIFTSHHPKNERFASKKIILRRNA